MKKFRVWNNTDKKYEPIEDNNFRFVLSKNGELSATFSYTENKEYVFEQYVGLQDKNGREIYEGDTIQHFAFDDGDLKKC